MQRTAASAQQKSAISEHGWLERNKGRHPWSFFLHSLFGLKLSLLFGFVCFTGTVATVSHEIEWLLLPKVRASASAEPASWGSLWDAARAAYPQVVFDGIARPASGLEDYLARVARGTAADGRAIEVYIDPGSGVVTGHSTGTTFHALMRGLHYYLLAPTEIPFYAITSLGLVMLLSLVSGLIVYKKFWRGFLRWPRFDKAPRVWWGDVHRLIALWSLWFVLVIGLTSVWYLVERPYWLAWESDAPRLAHPPPTLDRPQSDGARIDHWVALAQRQLSGLQVTAVSLPYTPDGVVTVQGQRHAWLVRERAHAVYIDARDDRVVQVRDAQAMGLAERIVHTADPLHFGDFLGLPSKIVWAAFGLALVALAVSGAVIYTRRTRDALARLARRRAVRGLA